MYEQRYVTKSKIIFIASDAKKIEENITQGQFNEMENKMIESTDLKKNVYVLV